jgi:serine/threonine-protein kinase RsbW
MNMTERSSQGQSSQTLHFPARFESLAVVGEFVGLAAKECGFEPSDVYDVQLAVDEACSNIIEHAYGGECHEDIECTCQIADETLTVVLEDCGRPFNPLDVPAPNLNADLKERNGGGLGLYFMRHLMDLVSFQFIPDKTNHNGRNVLIMVKHNKGKEKSS